MQIIRFEATLYKIDTWTVLRLPAKASAQLPSRGMTLVEVSMGNFHGTIVLEPDGKGSHWFRFTTAMQQATKATDGDTVTLEILPSKAWPEPDVPADIQAELDADPTAYALWRDVTPMARWDWIRWIRSTNVAATRAHRIEVARSKLKHGLRRPCCFNRNVCTEPYVSHNWMLRESSK